MDESKVHTDKLVVHLILIWCSHSNPDYNNNNNKAMAKLSALLVVDDGTSKFDHVSDGKSYL